MRPSRDRSERPRWHGGSYRSAETARIISMSKSGEPPSFEPASKMRRAPSTETGGGFIHWRSANMAEVWLFSRQAHPETYVGRR
jgi:hypothetical protein